MNTVHPRSLLVLGTLLLSLSFGAAEAKIPQDFLSTIKDPEFLKEGTVIIDTRFRYEHADQDGLDAANAFTARVRLGYETAALHGFNGLIEMQHTAGLNQKNNYGLPWDPNGKTVVLDANNTNLNRLQVSYRNDEWKSGGTGGRQRILLDNQRFIGNVGWRQNEQTYDAVRLYTEALEDLRFEYIHLWQVNRFAGLKSSAPLGVRRWQSTSHAIQAKYTRLPAAKLTLYSYLFDFGGADGGTNNSDTFGGFLTGDLAVNEFWTLAYRAEIAHQQDAHDNPRDYKAWYYHVNVGAKYDRYNAGIGYEVLGADNDFGFRFPLGTNHAFNGWADKFAVTPSSPPGSGGPAGLRDFYIWAGANLPNDISLRVAYHTFRADSGTPGDLGRELNLSIARKFGDHWTLLAKAARYWQGADLPAFADTDKFWLQLEFAL